MITATELIKLISDNDSLIIESRKGIKSLTAIIPANDSDYRRNVKELKRLNGLINKAKENNEIYRQVNQYISYGIRMEGIKEQRNQLLVKMATVDERLKYDEVGLLRAAPLSRATKNKEERALINKHDTKYGVKKLKAQLKVLNFILK